MMMEMENSTTRPQATSRFATLPTALATSITKYMNWAIASPIKGDTSQVWVGA